MGFTSFAGRVLFASVFLLSAWRDTWEVLGELDSWQHFFNPAAECFPDLKIGLSSFSYLKLLKQVEKHPVRLQHGKYQRAIDPITAEFNEFGVDGGPAAEAFKPKFRVFTKHVDSQLGVHIPEIEMKHIVAGAIALKGIGGILFIFGSSLGAYLLVLHLAISTPILCDFYNYDIEKIEFLQLFIKFTQNLALFGALLFFLGMKNSIPRRHLKKKAAPKTKTV